MAEAVAAPDIDGGPLAQALGLGLSLFYVRDRVGAASLSFVAHGVEAAGAPLVVLDLGPVAADDDDHHRRQGRRTARLLHGAVLAVDRYRAADRPTVVADRHVHRSAGTGGADRQPPWDPAWASRPPLVARPARTWPDRWRAGCRSGSRPEQTLRAEVAADRRRRRAAGRDVTVDDLAAGARLQNAAGLERLALRIEPQAGWDDLVLPADVVSAALRARRPGPAPRPGPRRLGDAAGQRQGPGRHRAVRRRLGHRQDAGRRGARRRRSGSTSTSIDLATVVDKYIGETEKNLDRIFARGRPGQRRAALRRGRRHLRQALRGPATPTTATPTSRSPTCCSAWSGSTASPSSTTNLRANIDDAFLRRLDALVDFPCPTRQRLMLWERHLPGTRCPGDDVDLDFLARPSSWPAATSGTSPSRPPSCRPPPKRVLTHGWLVRATGREYRKLGRLVVANEFGPYHHLVS